MVPRRISCAAAAVSWPPISASFWATIFTTAPAIPFPGAMRRSKPCPLWPPSKRPCWPCAATATRKWTLCCCLLRWRTVRRLRRMACASAQHGHRLPAFPPVPGVRAGDVVLSGHTHIPRGETIDGVHFWNPGSTTLPKGGFPPSYGLFEDGVFRVFSLDGRLVLEHRPAGN